MSEHDVAVVGAGPAGLSVAFALADAGLRPLALDAAERVGSSWRGRYDRLRLNTSRPLSHLPGRRFPKGTPMFPTPDQMVEHLEHHAADGRIDLRLGTRVARLERDGTRWRLRTDAEEIPASQVVVATGNEREPFIPDWEGREAFAGPLLHWSEYRNPDRFRGRRVLVIGPGCSGMEIAYDLAAGGAARV
jgi:cation diffusion facilitator CzcD-associated flavoprotein CzcO